MWVIVSNMYMYYNGKPYNKFIVFIWEGAPPVKVWVKRVK